MNNNSKYAVMVDNRNISDNCWTTSNTRGRQLRR